MRGPMSRFEHSGALTYDDRIQKLIPGYDVLHLLTIAQLKAILPHRARIVVIGAGTGKEIVAMAEICPDWHFVAVEPSPAMLEIANHQFKLAEISNRVVSHGGYLRDLKCTQSFDAALCLLVMHFLDEENKQALLKEVARCLKPGGQLLSADLMASTQAIDLEVLRHACSLLGMSQEKTTTMLERLSRDFHPICLTEFSHLLKNAGFGMPQSYFQAATYQGFRSEKLL